MTNNIIKTKLKNSCQFILIGLLICSFTSLKQNEDYTDNEKKNANTATNTEFMSSIEKEVIYLINLCRINPKKFLDVFVENSNYIKENTYFINKSPKYLSSLKSTLKALKPMNALNPDKELYEMALCLAKQQEKTGDIGHNRKKCPIGYYGECCSYGMKDAEGIVMQLLVDLDVPSLGHRKILLGDYSLIGVSIKGHKKYDNCAVLDLK